MAKVLLKCSRGEQGINAFIEVDGIPDPGLTVQNVNRWQVSKLRRRAMKKFDSIEVDGSCAASCPQFMYRMNQKFTIWNLLYVILEFFSYI